MLLTSCDEQTSSRRVRISGRSLFRVLRVTSLMSVAQTEAPSSANAMAVARPMPCPAAVTRATFPASLPLILVFSIPASMRFARNFVTPTPRQEIQICTSACLLHVSDVKLLVTAFHRELRWPPLLTPFLQLLRRNIQMQLPRFDIKLNKITIVHQSKVATNRGFRTSMKHDRAICCTAHARVRDADHVRDSTFQYL